MVTFGGRSRRPLVKSGRRERRPLSYLPDAAVRFGSRAGFAVAEMTVLCRHEMNGSAARTVQFHRQAAHKVEAVRIRMNAAGDDFPGGRATKFQRPHHSLPNSHAPALGHKSGASALT